MNDLLKTEQEDGKTTYLLKRGPGEDTEYNEITEWQYNAIKTATTTGASTDLSEAAILRLHQESDPASPLFKGSEPADGGITSDTAAGTQPSKSYYEPTGAELEEAAESIPEPEGTTVKTTEEVSKPYEAPVEEEHVISQEDLDENPDLVGQVEVGDPVTLGEPVENLDVTPEVTSEQPANMTNADPEIQAETPAKPKGKHAGNSRT